MKNSILFSSAIVIAIMPSSLAIHKLTAVSPFTDEEDYWIQIKNSIPISYVSNEVRGNLKRQDFNSQNAENDNSTLEADEMTYPGLGRLTPSIDIRAKSRICEYIFKSALFHTNGEEWVDFVSKDIHVDFKRRYPFIYEAIFNTALIFPRNEFANPYELDWVIVGERKISEHTFRCLTLRRPENEVKEYFISPIYNTNLSTEFEADIIHGRFIFAFDNDRRRRIVALAEEPATVNGKVVRGTHLTYYRERRDAQPLQDVSTNPVCRMTISRKIRLCTSALNASQFRGKILFVPKPDQIEPVCEKRTVFGSVLRDDSKEILEITYEEWMMGCKAKYIGSGEEVVFYISRGYDANTLIVFKHLKKDFYVAHAGLSHVGLITDVGMIRQITLVVQEIDDDETSSD